MLAPPNRTMIAPGRHVYAGIALCSMGVLMQEVLLTRIFSLTIWYHLAYLTISTALLGFAAAGSLLAARPAWLGPGVERRAARFAAGAGLALLLALWILGPRPIEPDLLLVEPLESFLGLLAYYALVVPPFLLAGLAIAAPLSAFPERASPLYAADLLGAGCGCLLAVAALQWGDGAGAVAICASLFVGAAACYETEPGSVRRYTALAALLLLLSPVAHRAIEFLPAESKALGAALRDPQTEMMFTRWSPVNRVDVYQNPANSWGGWWGREGLSPRYRGPRPRTLSIQYDAHNGTDVYEWKDGDSLRILDHHVLTTPYALRPQRRVLAIGVGGGIDVQNALRHGATRVTGVDLQPITIELHREILGGWTGRLAERPGVELVAAEGRHHVRSTSERYDLVQITAVDTFSAQTSGAYVLAESYLYTVEAFEDYLKKLSEDGMISVILGDLLYREEVAPPLVTRLALVAREALDRSGVEDTRGHLLLVAAPKAFSAVQNLIVKKTPFTPRELARVRRFAASHGFLIPLAPDASLSPAIARVVHAAPGELGAVLAEQPFALEPTSDDRPFFFNVMRWGNLLGGDQIFWMFPGSATGLLVLVMMLGQALVLGALLVFLPLARVGVGRLGAVRTLGFLLYFLGLGLGFLMIEISFVQKYVLVLGYPTYSLSVTIFSLLVFAAAGAFLSRRGWSRPRRFLGLTLLATAVLVVGEVALLPWLRDASLAWPLAARIALTVALQCPLGIALGVYFPTGLELLRRAEPRLIPWAWAVNGVASVVATVLAVILGIELGFSRVALVAVAVYAVGTLALISALPRDPAAVR